MPENTASEQPTAAVGAAPNVSVSFVDVLDDGELLTGTPTIEEQTTTDLTITNKRVNTAALTISSKTVAVGKAVQFHLSGQVEAHSPYTIKITVSSDSTPAQVFVKYVKFLVDDQ